MYHPLVAVGNGGGDGCRSIGRVVVYHDDVKPEVGFLTQCRPYSVLDGTFAVAHRYDDRCLDFEVASVGVDIGQCRGIDISANQPQVVGRYLLHLYLHVAVARVDIIELLLATLPQVQFLLGIQIFRDVHDSLAAAADEQSEFVERSCLPVVVTVSFRPCLQEGRLYDEQRPEVEIVAHRSYLVVNHRCLLSFAALHGIVVGIQQSGSCTFSYLCDTLGGSHPHAYWRWFGAENYIICCAASRHPAQRRAAPHVWLEW